MRDSLLLWVAIGVAVAFLGYLILDGLLQWWRHRRHHRRRD